MDPVIEVLLLLKNNWSLTGNLSTTNIAFTTRLYDESISMPQIVVRPLGSDSSPPIDLGGAEATYLDVEKIGFHIYVRFKQDSNSSLGWAKNTIYVMMKEAERIIKSGSVLTGDDDGLNKVFFVGGWNRADNLRVRPPLLISQGFGNIIKYKREK